MKRIVLPFLLVLIAFTGSAQQRGSVSEGITALRERGVGFPARSLFQTVQRSAATDQRWSQACTEATALLLDPVATSGLLAQRPANFALELPTPEGAITLDLEYVEITTPDFSVVKASTDGPTSYVGGAHYRGMIRGVQGSLAAISVFGDEVMGLISDGEGDRVLGRLADGDDGMHVFYREADMILPHTASCATVDDGEPYAPSELEPQGGPKTVKCVRLYWEVNYDIFQGKGSVTNATNYVTGLFNQSAILYANDGISVLLSQVYVWDVPSPYTQTSTSALLDQFGVTRTSFNGDLAHLLGYVGSGGIAWLNSLCNSQTRYRMAYSDINSTFSNVPTYSWSVEVVTHEQGHNMGSRHTHACAWNGNNTAIDGCGPAAGYSEGSCAQGPVPSSSVGGTIMSYCHLTSSTIKFANGFGPQPTALIVSRVNSSSCLSNCATSCSAPTGLSAGSITTSSAMLSWTAASGAVSYTLQWKLASSGTWTNVTGLTTTSYSLAGLAANTAYNFQVMTVCSGGPSAYATAVNFTTSPAACGVPSNLLAGGLTSTSASLSWGAVSGAVSYNLQWKLAGGSTWTTVNGISGTSYSLVGLAANTAYDFQVMTVCSGGSSAYATAVNFTTSTAACGVPGNLAANSITSSSASLSWTAVSGAVSYNLQWKLASGSTWTTVSGITGTSHALTGLIAATTYNFKVMTVCSGNSSAYATAISFSTGAATCSDNYEPNGTQASSTQLTPNVTLNALIGSGTDIDWFGFSNSGSLQNIRATLTNLPANYNLRLYRGGVLVSSSTNSGTTSETIVLNNGTISSQYKVRVKGASSAFSTTQCYTLSVELSATPFGMPEGMSEGGVEEAPIAEDLITLFPNPANDQLTIALPSHQGAATIELLDALGRVVRTRTQGGNDAPTTFEISVADRTEGLYLVRVTMDGNTSVQRLIIAH